MNDDPAFEGGCFCGAVRYRGRGSLGVAICHCRDCQHVSGAPLVAWIEVAREDLEWTKGAPSYYDHTSDWPTPVRRSFCSQCGASLTYDREGSPELDITVASMDAPESVRPDMQVYVSSRVPWVHVDDDITPYERMPKSPPA